MPDRNGDYTVILRDGVATILDECGNEVGYSEARLLVEALNESYPKGASVYGAVKKEYGRDLHKIGMTTQEDYRIRLRQIRWDEKDSRIVFVHITPYPNAAIARQVEACLHEFFADDHVRGEWFNLSDLDFGFLGYLPEIGEVAQVDQTILWAWLEYIVAQIQVSANSEQRSQMAQMLRQLADQIQGE